MKLHIINSDSTYGGSFDVPDDPDNVNGIPYGTTKKEPPKIPEGMFCVWGGSGWNITNVDPNPPPVVYEEPLPDEPISDGNP